MINRFFFSSRRRHTRCYRDWSSDVCSSDLFGVAAMPARLALERGRWAEAAKLTLHPIVSEDGWKRFPQAESINAFARALGAARSDDAVGARREIERLHTLHKAL